MFVMRHEPKPVRISSGSSRMVSAQNSLLLQEFSGGILAAQLFQYRVELFQVPVFDFQGAPLAAVIHAYL